MFQHLLSHTHTSITHSFINKRINKIKNPKDVSILVQNSSNCTIFFFILIHELHEK